MEEIETVVMGRIRLTPDESKCGIEFYDAQGAFLDRLECRLHTLLGSVRKAKEICHHARCFLPATREELMAAFTDAKRRLLVDMKRGDVRNFYDAQIEQRTKSEGGDLVQRLIDQTVKVERFGERAQEDDVTYRIHLRSDDGVIHPFTLTNKDLCGPHVFQAKYVARFGRLLGKIEPWPDIVNHWLAIVEPADSELPETPAMLLADRIEQHVRTAEKMEASTPLQRQESGAATNAMVALRDGDNIFYASTHIQRMLETTREKVGLRDVAAILHHRKCLSETSKEIRVGGDKLRFWVFNAAYFDNEGQRIIPDIDSEQGESQ